MYQLNIIDSIGAFFSGSASDAFEILEDVVSAVHDLIELFIDSLVGAVELIISIFTYVPNLVINSMFSELPYVFRIGMSSLFTIIMGIFILKLFQQIKFW